MRIFFSVGEPSGDLHGSNLIGALKQRMPTVECVGFGGPKMARAGCDLHFELTALAVMFFGEVLKNIRLFFRLIAEADAYFRDHDVDAVVLIDYPGFNWWIARKAKKHGIPVFYYGTPQLWAWAPWRVRKIRKFVDHVLCKLPFEVDWFAQRGCRATYVGHPYFDQLETQTYDQSFLQTLQSKTWKLVTLLPGSRDQEVKNVLPILLSAADAVTKEVENCRVVIASFNQRQQEMAIQMVARRGLPFEVCVDRTPELMKSADVCLACSGSVSMELLHYRKPTIIVYKVKKWAMLVQALVMRIKFITLVNLIAAKDIRKKTWAPFNPDAHNDEKAIMPEYLTSGDPSLRVARRVVTLLSDDRAYRSNVSELDALAKKYAIGGATARAADYILKHLLPERFELGAPDDQIQVSLQRDKERPAA